MLGQIAGVNSTSIKEVIDKIGEYDETLFRGEDVDYNWRLKLNGWHILYHPEIKSKTYSPINMEKFVLSALHVWQSLLSC